MNRDRVEGSWRQVKGLARTRWAKLTGDQLGVIAGKRERMIGKIQELYGISKEETERQVGEWEARQGNRGL